MFPNGGVRGDREGPVPGESGAGKRLMSVGYVMSSLRHESLRHEWLRHELATS